MITKNWFVALVVGSGFLSGCDQLRLFNEEQSLPGEIIQYVIPTGEHYAKQSAYQPMEAEAIRFKARFDSSAVYTTVQTENQGDINKLFGVSDCNSSHQINSARFGWRWYNTRLEILAYVYTNGKRNSEYVTTVPINTLHTYEILFTDSSYVFNVDCESIELPRGCSGRIDGYKLYPYFGGDERAPHTITIEIEELADLKSF